MYFSFNLNEDYSNLKIWFPFDYQSDWNEFKYNIIVIVFKI